MVTWTVLARWLLFGLAFFGCAELGHFLSLPDSPDFATFWPAAGLYMAALSLSPKREWAGYIVLAIVANGLSEWLLHGTTPALAIAFCVANTLEATIGATLLQLVHRRPFAVASLADTLWMAGLGATAATLASAAVGAAAVTQAFGTASFWHNMGMWWFAAGVGVLAVAPMLLTFPSQLDWKRPCGPKVWLEAAAVGSLVVLSSLVAFGPKLGIQRTLPAYPFVVAPFLIWCGLRFGQFGTAVGVFLASIIAVWGTTRGYGLFATMEVSLEMKAASLQVYVLVVTVTPLMFAAVIQQQRQAEDRLKQNLKLLQAVMDGTNDAIFVKDLAGRYLLVNSSGARMLDKTAEEVVGQDDFELFDEKTALHIRQQDQRTIAGGQTVTYDAAATSKNGKFPRHFQTTKGPFRDADGRIVGVVGIARDVSEQTRAEEVLRASEARVRAMFELGADAIIWIDERGAIEAFNPAAERMFGYPAQAVVGKNIKMLMPPPYCDEHDEYLANYLRTRVRKILGHTREVAGRRADGSTFPLELMVSEVFQGSRRTFSGVVRDITERHLAQQALEEAKRDLERRVAERTTELVEANQRLRLEMSERSRAEERLRDQQTHLAHAARLSSLGEMAAEMAHEMNQPLSAITNYVRGTQRRSRSGLLTMDEVLSTLEIIDKEANRAADVIRRTKNFVRKQPSSRQPLDLGVVVSEALALVEHDLRERRVRLDVRSEPALPRCAGDSVQLQQVIVNLVLNAADALQSVPSDQRQITLTVGAHDDSIQLSIVDTGPGISPAAAEKVFDTFFSTKPEGLGLGLPISRGIIEDHGGKLWAERGVRGGACLRFTLPVWEGPDDDLNVAPADSLCSG